MRLGLSRLSLTLLQYNCGERRIRMRGCCAWLGNYVHAKLATFHDARVFTLTNEYNAMNEYARR